MVIPKETMIEATMSTSFMPRPALPAAGAVAGCFCRPAGVTHRLSPIGPETFAKEMLPNHWWRAGGEGANRPA